VLRRKIKPGREKYMSGVTKMIVILEKIHKESLIEMMLFKSVAKERDLLKQG